MSEADDVLGNTVPSSNEEADEKISVDGVTVLKKLKVISNP